MVLFAADEQFPVSVDDDVGGPVIGRVFARRPVRVDPPEERLAARRGGAALERGDLADAVGDVGGRRLGAGDFAERRQQIHGGEERGAVDLARRDLAGPAGDEGHVDPALEQGALVAFPTGCDSLGRRDAPARAGGGIVGQIELRSGTAAGGSVVGTENHQRVLRQFQPVQRGQDLADAVIGVGDHGGVDLVFAALQVAEPPLVFGHRVKGRVRLVNPQVDEKGLFCRRAFFDKGNRAGGVLMHGDLLPGAVEGAVVVVAVNFRQGRIRDHVIRKMPFAVVGRRVAGGLQHPRQRRRLGVEPVGHVALGVVFHPGEVAVDVVAGGKMPGQDGGPAGRTHAARDREPVEIRALPGQPVDVRGLHIRVAVTRQVAPAPVVGEDEDDVGLWRRDRRRDRPQQNKRDEDKGPKDVHEGKYGVGGQGSLVTTA